MGVHRRAFPQVFRADASVNVRAATRKVVRLAVSSAVDVAAGADSQLLVPKEDPSPERVPGWCALIAHYATGFIRTVVSEDGGDQAARP